ncbi:Trypsin-like serine protease [Basidiobolus ranarum]|uniref:Trypsin-like serine protease n=1 Tax=Basidiobolus ranarum TaxID=34480 RepID=A0ABR2W8H6_9FUNG
MIFLPVLVHTFLFFISCVSTLDLKSNPQSHIVGGTVTQEGELPFMARVLVKNVSSCGGFILSQKWIGTAAHCVVDQETLVVASPIQFQIIVGTTSNTTDFSNLKRVVQVVTAPGYSTNGQKNDLALLELEQELTFSNRIQPIPISNSKIAEKETFTAAGWGITENATSSARLLKVDLLTAPISKCRKVIPDFKDNNGPQICIDAEVNKDTCAGDSGGPLFRKEGNGTSLYGVTSYSAYPLGASTVCGGKDTILGVYTHLSRYIPFLVETMGITEQKLVSPYDSAVHENPSNGASHPYLQTSLILSILLSIIINIYGI